MNLQLFGGRGGGSGMSGSGGGIDAKIRSSKDYVGNKDVEYQINNQLRYNLGMREDYATIDSFKIVSTPDSRGYGDVEAHYSVTMRIPVGVDSETGRIEFENDTEYRTNTFNVKLRKGK